MSDENDGDHARADGKPLAPEPRPEGADGRRVSPSAARNKDAIRDVFLARMPNAGRILEIASGTGEHGVHIAAQAPRLDWVFTDIDPASMQSQAAWIAASGREGLEGPHALDAGAAHWGEAIEAQRYDGLVCINMIHIAPFEACEGVFAAAGRLLKPGGKLFFYGPFARDGEIAPSNARFSEDLKRGDPAWGVRDLDRDLAPLAQAHGLVLDAVVDMPANNLSVVYRRA